MELYCCFQCYKYSMANIKHFSKALHVHIIKEVEMALSAELV